MSVAVGVGVGVGVAVGLGVAVGVGVGFGVGVGVGVGVAVGLGVGVRVGAGVVVGVGTGVGVGLGVGVGVGDGTGDKMVTARSVTCDNVSAGGLAFTTLLSVVTFGAYTHLTAAWPSLSEVKYSVAKTILVLPVIGLVSCDLLAS